MTMFIQFGELNPTPPFDLSQSVTVLEHDASTQNEQTTGISILTKAASLCGQVVVFQLRSTGTMQSPCLAYNLYSEHPLTAALEQSAINHIQHYLGLEDDLTNFYTLGKEDPYFYPLINQLYGYHPVRFPSPFEAACWAILSQRTSPALALYQKQTLTEHFGGSLVFHGARHTTFPEPATLATVDIAELKTLLKSERRSVYLHSTAQAFAQIDENNLRTATYEEIYNWLMQISGIGPQSAAYILVYGWGRMEKLPLHEKRIKEDIDYWYGQGNPLTEGAIQQMADYYGNWKGYWAYYLRAAGRKAPAKF